MSDLKVGLIGCGHIARSIHLEVLASLPEVEVVAIAEPDENRRSEAARRVPDAALFDHYRTLISESDAEAVVVCLPSGLHAEAAISAFELGKHVYLEKPIATTLPDAQTVLDRWRSAGTVGMTGFNYRFHPLYQTVKEHIDGGILGDLVAIRTVFSSAVGALPPWKQRRSVGGGALLDLGSHHFDLIPYVLGRPIAEVFAQIRSLRSEDDSVVAHMRITDGLPVQSFFSISAVDEDRFEVFGQAGKLTVDRHAGDLQITGPRIEYGRLNRMRREIRSLPDRLHKATRRLEEPSYRAGLGAFVEAIKGAHAVRPDIEDGYRSLRIVRAAEESSSTQRVITVDRQETDSIS